VQELGIDLEGIKLLFLQQLGAPWGFFVNDHSSPGLVQHDGDRSRAG